MAETWTRWLRRAAAPAAVLILVVAVPAASAASATARATAAPVAVHHDTSLPLRELLALPAARSQRVIPLRRLPRPAASAPGTAAPQAPAAAQAAPAPPATLLNLLGVGQGFSGPAGSFTVESAPPDTNAAVGPNQIVETVNTDLAVFDKSGTAVYGPVGVNTLWAGFGGGCQTNNDGDMTVSYDQLAERWVIQQFSVSTTPYLDCVAVSATSDPTGAYHRYSFQYSNFPDYPKLSVWPDAYYITYNMFNGNAFAGGEVCALNRARMLAGESATQQCFNVGASYGGLLAGDLDGTRQPPAGSPEYVVSLGASANQLAYWKFHVDWATPGNTTLTGPTGLGTAAFTEACGGGICIPQTGTTQKLDSLGDRLMYRLAYRNFGDHEALVVNHSITAGTSTGVRWYELRPDSSHNLSIFQQGTYAPDSSYRWMGSIAQDQEGDMGLGFSVSSSAIHPQIHFTGRLAGDPAGSMTQGEGTIINGAGSQTGKLERWGDYSSMAVDPSEECTFLYAQEYIPANGSFNWATRLASFKLPGCGVSNDFSMSASPTGLTLAPGASGTSTISTAVTKGSAQSVGLSFSGLPAGATASLTPSSVTAGGSSTLEVNAGTAAPGTYTLTVTGTGSSATHSTTVGLTIAQSSAIVNGGFETGTLSGWKTAGAVHEVIGSGCHSGSFCARLGSTVPTSLSSTITQKFKMPAGQTTLSLWYLISCPDIVKHDWALVKVTDITTKTPITLVPRTCTNTNTWVRVQHTLTAGDTYTLALTSHDDDKAGDPTYTLFDDAVTF